MGPDVELVTARALAAPDVRDGIVARRELAERLEAAGRAIVVSAPAGSGKTVLLRSWVDAAGLGC
jgi:ATP/maltotriose-dependent transcriptional regulator MalT